jgi:hypothetical protein
MKKNDLINTSKIDGIMFEYKTKDMRLLLRIFMEECDDPKSKFITNLTAYNLGSQNGRKIMEAGEFDTYADAVCAGVNFVENNFNLIEID